MCTVCRSYYNHVQYHFPCIVNLPLICVSALLMYYLNEYFNELLKVE